MLTSIPTSLSSSISPSCHLKYICIGQRIKSFEANFPEMVSFSCKVEQFLLYCAQHWQNATTRLRRRKSIHVLQNIKRERTLNNSTLKNKATSSTTHDILSVKASLSFALPFWIFLHSVQNTRSSEVADDNYWIYIVKVFHVHVPVSHNLLAMFLQDIQAKCIFPSQPQAPNFLYFTLSKCHA